MSAFHDVDFGVGGRVYDSTHDSVYHSVYDSVYDSARERAGVYDIVRAVVYTSMRGAETFPPGTLEAARQVVGGR
jgi:hypothetical protein